MEFVNVPMRGEHFPPMEGEIAMVTLTYQDFVAMGGIAFIAGFALAMIGLIIWTHMKREAKKKRIATLCADEGSLDSDYSSTILMTKGLEGRVEIRDLSLRSEANRYANTMAHITVDDIRRELEMREEEAILKHSAAKCGKVPNDVFIQAIQSQAEASKRQGITAEVGPKNHSITPTTTKG